MSSEDIDQAEEYIRVFGLHEGLFNAISDGMKRDVIQYIHEASGFDDDALEDVANDFDIGVDDLKREFLLK